MQVTLEDAEANLSELIDAALSGEEVVISKGDMPVAKIVPIARSSFKIGLLKDRIGDSAPDFFEPMSEDEIAGWEGSH